MCKNSERQISSNRVTSRLGLISGAFLALSTIVPPLVFAHEFPNDRKLALERALKNELANESQAVKNGLRLRYKIAHSKPGDVIELEPGHYTFKMPGHYNVDRFFHYEANVLDVRINHSLTLRGTDPDASKTIIDAQGSSYQAKLAKGILVTRDARHQKEFPKKIELTVENLTFQNAVGYSSNGAAIRAQGSAVTVRNCRFINNENGILFTSVNEEVPANDYTYAGSLTILDSHFEKNGEHKKELAHGIYMSQGGLLTVRNTNFINTKHHGHHIKSLAARTIVTGSTFDNESNEITYNIDTPNGGNVLIQDNVFTYHRAPDGEDNRSMFNYSSLQSQSGKLPGKLDEYVFRNNQINNHHPRAKFINLDEDGSSHFKACGNKISNLGDGKVNEAPRGLTKACANEG